MPSGSPQTCIMIIIIIIIIVYFTPISIFTYYNRKLLNRIQKEKKNIIPSIDNIIDKLIESGCVAQELNIISSSEHTTKRVVVPIECLGT